MRTNGRAPWRGWLLPGADLRSGGRLVFAWGLLAAGLPAIAWGLLAAGLPATAWGLTALPALDVSPDVTVDLSGQVLADEDVGEDDLLGGVVPLDVGPVPAAADVQATFDGGASDRLLSLDITTNLPGAGATGPADVARWDGATYAIEFDGAAAGVPPGARVDAVARAEDGDLLLSFDVTVSLGGVVADDEDLVRFDAGTGAFSLFFDGSGAGVATGLDLDAAERLAANGNLLVSFDTAGTVGGVTFSDEDVLEFDPVGGDWELSYDGSGEHASWSGADVDAISVMPMALDSDADGILDDADNCTEIPNSGQEDLDGDEYGDMCDCDFTNDGVCDINDFSVFLADFSAGVDSGVGTDMSSDGTLGIEDFSKFLVGFSNGAPGPSGTAD